MLHIELSFAKHRAERSNLFWKEIQFHVTVAECHSEHNCRPLITLLGLLREILVPNGISAPRRSLALGRGREGGDVVGQTGFVAVEIRNKKEG